MNARCLVSAALLGAMVISAYAGDPDPTARIVSVAKLDYDWRTGEGGGLGGLTMRLNNKGITSDRQSKSGWVNWATWGIYTDDNGEEHKLLLKDVCFWVNDGGSNWLEFSVGKALSGGKDGEPVRIATRLEKVTEDTNQPVIVVDGQHTLVPQLVSLSRLTFVEQEETQASDVQDSDAPDADKPSDVIVLYLQAAAKRDKEAASAFLSSKCEQDIIAEIQAKADSGWRFDPDQLKIRAETIGPDESSAVVSTQMVFDGGGTFMGTSRKFFLILDGNRWLISRMDPAPAGKAPGVIPLRR